MRNWHRRKGRCSIHVPECEGQHGELKGAQTRDREATAIRTVVMGPDMTKARGGMLVHAEAGMKVKSPKGVRGQKRPCTPWDPGQ
jgi:hypothetical protein